MGKESTAQQQQEQQDQNQGPSRAEFDALKAQVNAPLGFVEVLITHPLKHFVKPGIGNKVEGVLGLGGRAGAGYGLYKGVRWLISKIQG